MTTDQILIAILLCAMLVLFMWGRFRYDLVALAALLAAVVFGLGRTKALFQASAIRPRSSSPRFSS